MAYKNFGINFECYDLKNGKDPTVEMFTRISDKIYN